MSSTAHLRWDPHTVAVPVDEWSEFCDEHAIVFSPNTVGRNVFYAGEVEIHYGDSDYDTEDPKLPDGRIDFAAITPPDKDAYSLTFSTYHYGTAMADVAKLALCAWQKWGGTLEADEEIRWHLVAPSILGLISKAVAGDRRG